MASIKKDSTIREYQNFTNDVYGLNNDRYFSREDMLIQIQRFIMRALKGIRKDDQEKVKTNLLIAFSWFTSLINQWHLNLEDEIWQRFPYLCSYCASCPCACKEKRPEKRRKTVGDEKKRPKTIEDFQVMFEKIYPSGARTLEDAGVHLAEELGEFSEAIMIYRDQHKNEDFEQLKLEAADLFSCFMSVFNSMGTSVVGELSLMFSENCHACNKIPCECSFENIMGFKS